MATVPIEERIAIQDLVGLYPLYCDTHQFDKTADLFMEDCIFDETSVGAPLITGRAALHDLFRESADLLGPFMHLCANPMISSFAERAASGTCHVLVDGIYNLEGEHKPFRIFGYYDDRYEKAGDRWYFKARVLKLLVPPQGAVPALAGITYDVTAAHFATR
jgi:hypothetical protein